MIEKKKLMPKFTIMYIFAVVMMALILYKACYTIHTEGEHLRKLGQASHIKDSLVVKPARGNILAEDGKLLASSIPSYTLYMDFKADGFDSKAFAESIDSLAYCLSTVYKGVTPAELKRHILAGKRSGSRWFKVHPQKLSYTEMKRVKNEFPFFRMGRNKSGYAFNEQVSRKKPFGSLASRTIGGIYAEVDKGGASGIEKRFDSFLRGKDGLKSYRRIAGSFRSVSVVEPEDGYDVVTTLNVNMQDIMETALLRKLKEVEADHGCAVIMETESGKIKAISNLRRRESGEYDESINYAFSSMTEPGSTFKVASAIVAIEEGKADTSTKVDTGNGIWDYSPKVKMKDHNWSKGGYGVISLNQAIAYSSNIGVAKIIDKHYKNNPSRFVEHIYELGLNEPLDFEIPGAARPRITNPNDPQWSGTSLAWMSFGYETQIPPIYMLTFYNAIANHGKMVKPYVVKSLNCNGNVVKEFSTQVVKKQICSESTLAKVNDMLKGVVEFGTARNVHSNCFEIAGKTGTAQVDYGKKGVKKSHQLTFCGYFPADDPKYSMIVVVWSPNTSKVYPSAGAISGSVFKEIAERVYAQSPLIHAKPMAEADSISKMPITKDGNLQDLRFVLSELTVPYEVKGGEQALEKKWASSSQNFSYVGITPRNISSNSVPNVYGMGAKDAIYILENLGMKVRIAGKGRVVSQSVSAGSPVVKSQLIALELK